MEINGLQLPALFVQDIHEGKFQRVISSYELKENIDAYGNKLETEIGEVYKDLESIIRETNNLPKDFEPYALNEPNEWENESGYISYITDFSKVACFAYDGDGSAFCFDFREDKNNPSVIWWDDAYWRRIAPDYEAFIELFNFIKAE